MSIAQTLSSVFPQTGWEFQGVFHTCLATWLQDLVQWVQQDGPVSSAWVQDMFWDLLRPPFASLLDREAWIDAGRSLWEGTTLLAETAYPGVWHFLWMHSIHFPEGLKRVLLPVLAQDLWTELSIVVAALPVILDPMTTIPKDTPLFWITMSYMPQLERTRLPNPLALSEVSSVMTPESPEAPLSEDTNTEDPMDWAAGWPTMNSELEEGILTEPIWSDTSEMSSGSDAMLAVSTDDTLPPMGDALPATLIVSTSSLRKEASSFGMVDSDLGMYTLIDQPFSLQATQPTPDAPVPHIQVESRLIPTLHAVDIAMAKAAKAGKFPSAEAMIRNIQANLDWLPEKARTYHWAGLLEPGHRDFGPRLALHAPLFSGVHWEEAAVVMGVRRKLYRNPRVWNPNDPDDCVDRREMLHCILKPVQGRLPVITVKDVLIAMHTHPRWWVSLDEVQSLLLDRISQSALKQVMDALVFYEWAQRRSAASGQIYGYAASPDARVFLTGKDRTTFEASAADWEDFIANHKAMAAERRKKNADLQARRNRRFVDGQMAT